MFRSALTAFFVLTVASLGLVSYVTRHGATLSFANGAPAAQKAVSAAPATTTAVAQPQLLGAETILRADPLGHFAADVDIDGHAIRMLVDTGASLVALTNEDAATLGLRRSNGDFRVEVATANGTGRAAQTRLWRVRIGGVEIYDVDALVFPPGVLKQSLLGMSALRKLRNFEISAGRLVLQQ